MKSDCHRYLQAIQLSVLCHQIKDNSVLPNSHTNVKYIIGYVMYMYNIGYVMYDVGHAGGIQPDNYQQRSTIILL